MKKLLIVLIALMFFAVPVMADPFLTCEKQDAGVAPADGRVTHYLLQFDDSGTWIKTDAVIFEDGVRLWYDMASFPDGNHTVRAKAANFWGESAPTDPFVFIKKQASVPVKLQFGTN